MFERLRTSSRADRAAEALLTAAREQSRTPALFGAGRIPDTLDGRFESLVLHVVVLLERLHGGEHDAQAIAQKVFDALFRDLDGALREIGVGDLSVGKKIRKMGEAFYGRAQAYRTALADDELAVRAALARNVFVTSEPDEGFLAALARYVRASHQQVVEQPIAELLDGGAPRWAAVPG